MVIAINYIIPTFRDSGYLYLVHKFEAYDSKGIRSAGAPEYLPDQ